MSELDEDFAKTYEEGTTQEEALAAGERLLSRPDFPHQEQLRKNITYWLPKLPGGRADLTIPVPEGWSCFNPSVAVGPEGNLRAIIRTANYVMSPEGRYGGAYDTDRVIRTRNYLADFTDSAFTYEIIGDGHLRPDYSLYPVEGFEDARLFYHRGWKFSATVRERNPRGICQQVQCSLKQDSTRATALRILSPAHDIHEKNWMPFTGGSWRPKPVYIKHCYPTVGAYEGGGHWDEAPYIARAFRGGSQLIQVKRNEYLAVIHESIDFPGQTPHRVYWHRLVLFHAGKIKQISQPFCFQRRGVEFCAGAALHGEDLLLSYGVADKEAWLHRMPLETALGMLTEAS